jgi:hypothetical protein
MGTPGTSPTDRSVEPLVTGTATPPRSAPLTAADRCDRCGAAAKLRVQLPGGGELLFCGHHGNRFAGSLREKAAQFRDESGAVVPVP